MIKKLQQTVLLLIIISELSFPQWSTDPNNNLIIGYGLDPHICSDSAGGCYVTYDYESLYYPRKLALERLDKYGYKPWGTKKQILGELPEQWQAEIIEDGEGGVIVSYIDRFENLPSWTARVRVQRVDSSGNFLWGQTGIRVTLDTINQGDYHLSTDGDGGCVIAWQDVNYTYYVNRIDGNGNRLWGDKGIILNRGPYNSQPRVVRAADVNYYVQTGSYIYRLRPGGEIVRSDSVTLGYIVPDLEGGIVLSDKVWTGMIPKLAAQRKDSLGNNLWQEPYVEIADSLDIGTSLNILSNNSYYHYGWLGRKNGVAEILQIQSLRNDGTKLFIGGSIQLSNLPSSITSIPIIASYDGSNIYAWIQWNSPQTYNANYARRIDSTGSDRWQDSSVLLNEPSLGYFSMITDCAGGAIGVGYLNADFAIRVLKVSVNGILGEVITDIEVNIKDLSIEETFLYQNYPNPYNSSTILKYQIPQEGMVKINLYNILGEKIKILFEGEQSSGVHQLILSSNEISSGVYLYTLETGLLVISKKLTIIK